MSTPIITAKAPPITTAQAARAAEAPARRRAKANEERLKAEREKEAAEYLELFKSGIADNDRSMRAATKLLVKAISYGVKQRAAAEAVGRSVSWVNRLVKWAAAGYPACGPFSTESKAKRKRAAKSVQAPEQPKSAKPTTDDKRLGIGGNGPPAEVTAEQRKVEYAVNDHQSEDKDSSRCLRDFQAAVNAYLPNMNARDRAAAQTFVIEFSE